MLRQLWSYRDLMVVLTRAQFKLRYRQSFMGFFGALLPPLATLGVGTIVFQNVVGVDTGTTSYQVFTLAALAPWTFFANALITSSTSVAKNIQMATRLAFPRAVLPLSFVGTSLIDLAIATTTFVVVVYAFGEGLTLMAAWFFVLLLIELVLVVGLAMFLSAVSVFAWDVKLVLPMAVNLWLLVTPVMYPLSSVPDGLRTFYLANPMTGLVESFRAVLVNGHAPEIGLLLPAIVLSVAALALGTWYFASTETRFADVI